MTSLHQKLVQTLKFYCNSIDTRVLNLLRNLMGFSALSVSAGTVRT